MDLLLFFQILNGTFGILSVISGLYMYKYHLSIFDMWPRNLRIFILYFCFFTAVLFGINTVILAVIAFHSNNTKPPIYHFFRLMLIFLCQQLRFSYFIIIMERMMATIYLEEYAKFSTNFKFFGIFLILSIFGHIICSLSSFLTFFEILPTNYLGGGYDNIIWISFTVHALTLISCKILYDKNQHMYKRLAYHCTLQQRHQIVENIKVLKILWPTILVFSVISPIGPAATLLFTLITNNVGPIGMFHMTYNLTPIIMAFFCKYYSQKRSEVFPTDSVAKEMQLVKSPFGASLPTHVSQEIYFNNLRDQWN